MGETIDWENPKNLNQWIHWLYFNSDTTEWPIFADKYLVRQIIENSGLKENLVPLYGEWDDLDDVDFSNLPKSFVLKMNNGCGDVMIVSDKNKISAAEIKDKFHQYFKGNYGKNTIENHYTKIKPRLIAEKLLDSESQGVKSLSMIDYKFWCFNGRPSVCFIALNRTKEHIDIDLYKANDSWERIEDGKLIYDNKHLKNKTPIPKPSKFEEMIRIASMLSAGHPQMRVDLYEVNGKVYFGELTMTSQAGRMNYFTQKFLKELGDNCKSACENLNIWHPKEYNGIEICNE